MNLRGNSIWFFDLEFLQASGATGFIDKEQIKDSFLFRVQQILAS